MLKVTKSLIVGLFALGTVCAASRAHACATLYEHANYGGRSARIGQGRMIYYDGFWNDRVSCIHVDPGCQITVYEHSNFRGASTTYASNVPYVGDGWNDRISSSICSCR